MRVQGLMLKLLNVDSPSERALRVVAYFDQLGANNPDLDSVVRATAVLADCVAGIAVPDKGLSLRFGADGRPVQGRASPGARSETLVLEDVGLEVWLERGDGREELDEFIVERFALAAASVIQRHQPQLDIAQAHGFSDPALSQIVVNERATEPERSRAAALLGVPASSTVQLIAFEPAPQDSLERARVRMQDAWGARIFFAPMSRNLSLIIAPLARPVAWGDVEIEGRAASGDVVDLLHAPSSWQQAREALRFAGRSAAWPRLLSAAELGATLLLARLETTEVLGSPDVAAIEGLLRTKSGPEDIGLLDHIVHTSSIRSAAKAASFHHSSVQSRVRRIEKALGLSLSQPDERARIVIALALWQVHSASI